MAKAKPETQTADQLRSFKEAARAFGCDEDEAAFDERLKAIARRKPQDEPRTGKPPKRGKADG